jgi:hypothetical protein
MFSGKYRGWLILSIIAGFIIGCSDDDKTTDPGGWQPPTQYEVGPEGDTIEVDNQLQFIIPPGALDSMVSFAFVQNNPPNSPPAPLGLVSSYYEIQPSGTNFNIPATLTLNYSEANLGGGDESTIQLYTYDGVWTALTTTVDVNLNRISAPLSHLSGFAGAVDTTSSAAEGIFAKLVVGRNITYIGAGDPYRVDVFEAVFDSTYAPCDPIQPIANVNVTCDDSILVWNTNTHMYTYPETPVPMNPLISLGGYYTFEVTAGGGVPALTRSILFPASEPYLTYPTMMMTLGRSGFNITWAGYGTGVVELTFMDSNGQIVIFEETPNDGSYAVSAALLSGLPSGECVILISHHNKETITAAGYDSRSYIAGRVQSQTMFTLE